MTNLLTSVSRKLIHTRKISTQAFLREDGLWDLEANLLDTKTRDFTLCSGIRKSGDAIHDMTLCITIDASFNILDAKGQQIKSVGYVLTDANKCFKLSVKEIIHSGIYFLKVDGPNNIQTVIPVVIQ